MGTCWYIGTSKVESDGAPGDSHWIDSLDVEIAEREYGELLAAVATIDSALRGVLFRLVFANHRAVLEVHEELESRSMDGASLGMQQLCVELRLALANWLSSVRWLLDHTEARLGSSEQKLRLFRTAASTEFDEHFAYRLAYQLRNYVTHQDLPPISVTSSTRRIAAAVESTLTLTMSAEDLLAWKGWTSRIRGELADRSDPIDVIDFVDAAMASVERVMHAIVVADDPEVCSAAQRVLSAARRLPTPLGDDEQPMLFAAQLDETSIKTLSPTPLPVMDALNLLNPPRVDGQDDSTGEVGEESETASPEERAAVVEGVSRAVSYLRSYVAARATADRIEVGRAIRSVCRALYDDMTRRTAERNAGTEAFAVAIGDLVQLLTEAVAGHDASQQLAVFEAAVQRLGVRIGDADHASRAAGLAARA